MILFYFLCKKNAQVLFSFASNKKSMYQVQTKYSEEKRMQRLLTAIHCAVECAEAATFYLEKNRHLLGESTMAKLKSTMAQLRLWTQQLASVEEDITANIHTLLYSSPPIISLRLLPNRFEVADMLYRIGYYQEREDYPFIQHPHAETIEELLGNEDRLEAYYNQVLQALVQAEYDRKWKLYAARISDLYMAQPPSVSIQIRILLAEKQNGKNLCIMNAQM